MAIIDGRGILGRRRRAAAGAALLLAGLAPAGARAQVVLDGTVGPAGALAGPDYAVGAELGRRAGANLFHSFARFGLRAGESATFSGPAGIGNVIGRVTGGEPSDIDGTLRSTVPGADLWFINPAGVTFGPNARLDVPGSLHVGTADELRFADGARFGPTDPAGSRLTVAAPEAFGFLGAEPGAIRVAGSLLEVPPGADLSLVGGDVSVEAAAIVARGGRIGLAGTAGPAEVAPGAADDGGDFGGGTVTVDGAFIDAGGLGGGTVALRGGGIAVTGRSFIVATSFGDAASGGISVVGADVRFDDSFASNNALGAGDAGPIVIRAGRLEARNGTFIATNSAAGSTGAGGDITLSVGSLDVSGNSAIVTNTESGRPSGDLTVTASERVAIAGSTTSLSTGNLAGSTGAGGRLTVTTPRLDLADGAAISTGSVGAGEAGDVRLDIGRLTVSGGAAVRASTRGTGPAGDLTIAASEAITLTGFGLLGGNPVPSALQAGTAPGGTGAAGRVAIRAPTVEVSDMAFVEVLNGGTGPGGQIDLRVGSLLVADNSSIAAGTIGPGGAGALTMTASEGVTLDGGGALTSFALGAEAGGRVTVRAPRLDVGGGSLITTAAIGDGGGGPLRLDVGRLRVTGGALVSTSTSGAGRAGNLVITARGAVTVAGTDSTLSALVGLGSSGDGGTIRIAAPRVAITDGGRITARSGGTGLAGNVVIEAGERLDVQDGTITTEAPAADGGRVTLRVGDRIDLLRARITTSVAGEAGNGGDIDIDPRFMVLDRSVIQANAVGGNGGNIDITVGNLIRTPDSVIEATSTLGIDGTISVSAPDEDLSRGLVALPAVYLDASGLLREGCAARRDVDTSSFTAAGRGGLPPGPDGPLPGFYALGDGAADADAASGGGVAPATGAAATAELATLVGFALTCGGPPDW